jgi:CRP-like cAMP-binding protein
LLSDAPHQVDVYAKEKSMVMVVDREDFFNLLRNDPFLGNKLLWSFCMMLGERLSRTGQQFAKLKFKLGDLTEEEMSDLADFSGMDTKQAARQMKRSKSPVPTKSPVKPKKRPNPQKKSSGSGQKIG